MEKRNPTQKGHLMCGRQGTETVIRCLTDAIWCANREATSLLVDHRFALRKRMSRPRHCVGRSEHKYHKST